MPWLKDAQGDFCISRVLNDIEYEVLAQVVESSLFQFALSDVRQFGKKSVKLVCAEPNV